MWCKLPRPTGLSLSRDLLRWSRSRLSRESLRAGERAIVAAAECEVSYSRAVCPRACAFRCRRLPVCPPAVPLPFPVPEQHVTGLTLREECVASAEVLAGSGAVRKGLVVVVVE